MAALTGYVDHATSRIAEAITGVGRAAVGGLVPLPGRRPPRPPGRRRAVRLRRRPGRGRPGRRLRAGGARAGRRGRAGPAWSSDGHGRCPPRPRWTRRGCGSSGSTCPTTRATSRRRSRLSGRYAVSSGNPRSQSRVRFSRSASRTTRSRLRRNCGSCGGQEHQPGQGPLAERVDRLGVAEVGLHLPVGGHRAEVDDPDVADRRDRLAVLVELRLPRAGRHGTSPVGVERSAYPACPGGPAGAGSAAGAAGAQQREQRLDRVDGDGEADVLRRRVAPACSRPPRCSCRSPGPRS